MTDHGVFLITGNVVHAHAGKEIVGVVVFADMFEAKAPIFPFAEPSLWRTVRCWRLAIRPFASGALRAQPPILVGLYADAVEQWRMGLHYVSMRAIVLHSSLDNGVQAARAATVDGQRAIPVGGFYAHTRSHH